MSSLNNEVPRSLEERYRKQIDAFCRGGGSLDIESDDDTNIWIGGHAEIGDEIPDWEVLVVEPRSGLGEGGQFEIALRLPKAESVRPHSFPHPCFVARGGYLVGYGVPS